MIPAAEARTDDGAEATEPTAGTWTAPEPGDVKPVFLDLTGRRRALMRIVGYALTIICLAALAALAAGLSPASSGTPAYVIGG